MSRSEYIVNARTADRTAPHPCHPSATRQLAPNQGEAAAETRLRSSRSHGASPFVAIPHSSPPFFLSFPVAAGLLMASRLLGAAFSRRRAAAVLLLTLWAMAILPMVATPQSDECEPWCTRPSFTEGSSATRSFNENIGNAETVNPVKIGAPFAATDADDGDNVVYEQIEDPDDPIPEDLSETVALDPDSDAHLFRIDFEGQLWTKSGINYDYEKKSTYKIRLVICDNAFNRDRIVVTIRLGDVKEPPLPPEKPDVEGTSSTTLAVSWTAPENEGRPPITSYDLDYQEYTPMPQESDWLNGPQNVRVTYSSISGLTPGTRYLVRVLATNAEGDGPWSTPGEGSTHDDDEMDRPPVFNEGDETTRILSENIGRIVLPVRNVGDPVTATNDDNDALTYSLEGADADSFTIDSETGQIRTKSGEIYNHETKFTYRVNVRVEEESSDGNSREDEIDVQIDIIDEEERPLTPDAPVVSSDPMSNSQLVVNWTEPDNAGRPRIVDYDLQYRQGTSGGWTGGPQNVSGTSESIGGLAPGKQYQVQVRATNADGDGPWSRPGSGSTNATDNETPTFGPPVSREFREDAEEGDPIGSEVMAADADLSDPNKNERLTYSLEGADADSFTIDSETGQIRATSGVTYDFEEFEKRGLAPIYSVTVKATDSRNASATVEVTINLMDAPEAPDAPAAPTVTTGSAPG